MEFKPWPYQRAVIDFIHKNPGAGVFLDMGLGKTAIALQAILEEIYDYCRVKKVLIIAPKKVAEATWQEEAGKWEAFKGLKISTVIGDIKHRARALAQDADIYITNRENTDWIAQRYRYKLPFDMLVLDESTSFKDAHTRRWRALRRSRGSFKRVVLLTGTPRPNSLMDLWAQIYLLDGGARLGRTLTEYRNNYFVPDKRNGMVIYSYRIRSPEHEKEIYQKISDICISMKSKDYLDLPDTLPPVVVPVKLPPEAMDTYTRLASDFVAEIAGEEITATAAAALSTKLLQLANGAIYDNDHKVIEIHKEKLKALQEIVECNTGKPILVFYHFVHDRERILARFKEAWALNGPADITAWNNGQIPMLVVHPASAGYGLNLQAGGHIIVWYGLTWSLEQYQQANARLARQGQKEPVIIHHLVAEGTLDTRVMYALKHKEKGQAAMLEAIKEVIRHETTETRG